MASNNPVQLILQTGLVVYFVELITIRYVNNTLTNVTECNILWCCQDSSVVVTSYGTCQSSLI